MRPGSISGKYRNKASQTESLFLLRAISIAVFVAAVGVTNAACPARNRDGTQAGNELVKFAMDAVNKFFPYQEGWETAYDAAFSKDLKASFNATAFTFDTFKALYGGVYSALTTTYQGTFVHGFLTVVGVPNANDLGGFVTLTGWEGGYVGGNGGRHVNTTDGSYVVISQAADCSRKIVEFRESSNLGSYN
ncbi:hypothetical protein F4677DRAFT_460373 [Hypoxylon crocopeplum]|nr:hypothetical protein F4677DRAFT_460373 [Hypoxylon crocopeplum]